jgi:two-component system, OmpR family, phosphate regulon sensor histidine kinase PhoR
LNWVRFTPFLLVLALCAGALGIFVPSLSSYGALGLVGFGIFGLLGLVEVRRRSLVIQERTEELKSEVLGLESEVVRHRDALDDLADGLDAMIFLVDVNFRLLYANSRADEFFKIGDRDGDLLRAITLSNELDEVVAAVSKTRTGLSREIVLRHPRERIVQAQCWPEEFGQDRLFLSLRDVTELRHLETVRRDFVANVSHELRTPMTTIRAMAETLEEGEDDVELRERYLGKIIREVDRLTRITDDLLTLSIAESGVVQRVECDLSEIAGSVCYQLEKKAKEKGMAIEVNRPKSLPFEGNETQITQIVFNLVDNAINYSTDGVVRVGLAEENGFAILTIADSGIGISSEHLPRIFERFYRVDKGRSRASGGTGLGLAIVKHLIELHGGDVSVESALNRGTTFTVRLPLPKVDIHLLP